MLLWWCITMGNINEIQITNEEKIAEPSSYTCAHCGLILDSALELIQVHIMELIFVHNTHCHQYEQE